MKKCILVSLISSALFATALCGCGGADPQKSDAELTVFNYGEYLDPVMLAKFTDETGIRIKYEEATTPEEMYTKFSSGAISYDLLCTSDYMLKRLIDEGKAQKIDHSTMENYSNIDSKFSDLSKPTPSPT